MKKSRDKGLQSKMVAKSTRCHQVIDRVIDNINGKNLPATSPFSPTGGAKDEKEYELLSPWAKVVASRLRLMAVTLGKAQEALDEILRRSEPK